MNYAPTNTQNPSVAEWFKRYGWQTNPFSFKIYEGIMIGNQSKIDEILKNIDASSAFNLVIGNTGAGKTNLMKWIQRTYQGNYNIYYLPNPPKTTSQLLEFFKTKVIRQGFISRRFSPITENNLHEVLQSKLKRPTLVIFDEGHEAPIEVLAWIRALVDHVNSLLILATGTPEFIDLLKKELPTLYNRAPSVITLEPLSKDEALELVRKRIDYAGGNGVEPFTYDVLTQIYQESKGFPRDILRLCHQTLISAILSNKYMIDEDVLRNVLTKKEIQSIPRPMPPKIYTVSSKDSQEQGLLSDKQQEVYDCLNNLKEATPSQVIDVIETSSYQSKAHALRSTNNVLTRMLKNNLVERVRKGRTYVYKIKNS